MQYKVLKHKRLEDTFGVFHAGDNSEIWQSSTPTLFGIETTMEYLKNHWSKTMAAKQIDNYELLTAELKIVQ